MMLSCFRIWRYTARGIYAFLAGLSDFGYGEAERLYLIFFVLAIGTFRSLKVGGGELHFPSTFVDRMTGIGCLGNFDVFF